MAFRLFNSFQIQHLAQLFQAKGLRAPSSIIFSGTGSKTLNLLDSSESKEHLTILTTLIFKKVLNTIDIEHINLIQDENPKEITCKGGLLADEVHENNNLRQVLLGTLNHNVISTESIFTYKELNSAKDITQKATIANVNQFLSFIKEINTEFSFEDNFSIDNNTFTKGFDVLSKDHINFYGMGYSELEREIEEQPDSAVRETLFFLALKGMINKLASQLVINEQEGE